MDGEKGQVQMAPDIVVGGYDVIEHRMLRRTQILSKYGLRQTVPQDVYERLSRWDRGAPPKRAHSASYWQQRTLVGVMKRYLRHIKGNPKHDV